METCARPSVWGGPRCPECRSRPASLWSSALWRSWSCCWVRAAAPGTPAPSPECLGWSCDNNTGRRQTDTIAHLQVSFSCTLTRSWRRAPPARPPAGWGGCAPPACSSAACSCWPTAAAESGSHCWWRTGHSGSCSACPPSADRREERLWGTFSHWFKLCRNTSGAQFVFMTKFVAGLKFSVNFRRTRSNHSEKRDCLSQLFCWLTKGIHWCFNRKYYLGLAMSWLKNSKLSLAGGCVFFSCSSCSALWDPDGVLPPGWSRRRWSGCAGEQCSDSP